MLFNSFSYMIFLPVVFFLYWGIQNRYRWILLLLSSYFFYMCSGMKYGLLIFFVTFVSYTAARLIERSDKGICKKTVLWITIAISLGLLFIFKYFDFFSESTNWIFEKIGIEYDPVILNIVLPVGISFYTFQTMSYVIDVYRGETGAERHFGKYAAFVSFFPQLVAGPIERPGNLLPQIKEELHFDYGQAKYGMELMLWGYYKKLVIADVLSEYVQLVFTQPSEYKGFSLILASLFFTIQIYCDFSGYSDIAIGTAKLFGISLMKNFDSPYFSGSIREFWSRWHISLSTWFRDYVYIPLGGNRVSVSRQNVNLLITFLASGLWHGANWTFVIWGGLHGIARIVENVFPENQKNHTKTIKVVRVTLIFCFCAFAWIFFVSNSVHDAIYVISNSLAGISSPITYLHDGFSSLGFRKLNLAITGACGLLLFVYDFISLKIPFIRWLSGKKKVIQWFFYLTVALMIVFLSTKGEASEFIYFQF